MISSQDKTRASQSTSGRPASGSVPRILVVGDVMIDHYIWGTSDRISPEAPVPVVDVAREVTTLGGAGNVVNNLLALGARVAVAAVVGDDPSGREIVQLLQRRALPTSAIVREPNRQSTRKLRVMVNHQLVVRLDRESRHPIRAETAAALLAALEAWRGQLDAVLLSDYDKGVLTARVAQSIVAWARPQNLPVLVDPKGTDPARYRGATLLKPNRKEAAEMTGLAIQSDADALRAARTLQRTLGIPYVVITLSEAGMALVGECSTTIPAAAREVFDVTGAGDTALAALGYGVASGMPLARAAALANRAAAVVVGKAGSATATWEEIDGVGSRGEPPAAGTVCSAAGIDRVVERLRREGRRIVFTTGCFDLLHRGHVEYLAASRACGDCLIVGINADASVRRLKGADRPVVGQQDRAHILAALGAVDYVVIFDEDTPCELLRRIRPDVLTKGGDYQLDGVVGRELAGEVRLISFFNGQSTSRTIDRIQRAA